MAETSSGNPYIDNGDIRTFNESVTDDELIWHRDKYNREITVLEGKNWKLQLDNRLPVVLQIGKIYEIPQMVYHRIIKGQGNLVIKIWEER